MISNSAAWRFRLTLALLLAALLVLFRPTQNGDVVEYSLTTIALASHATPEIRLSDIAAGKQLLPGLAEPYEQLERGMRENHERLYAAFTRGRDGNVYAVHFFGYSALAAVPYKLLQMAGLPPFKCFQVVNLAAIFILGLSLYRLFGSATRALLGLALFMLCGGALYWNWSSPECLSAAALLSGLILFTTGAPVAGALLAGLAAQQNPTILFFFGFAPLLQVCLHYQRDAGLRANLARALPRRYLLGLGAGLALFALPPLFNLWQFGVPNIIAKLFSNPALIGLTRLQSFYFDLNQGMIIGIPGVLAALAAWGWRLHDGGARRAAVALALCAVFTLALAVPALAVLNWNSGAAGVMRYAFWASMPFVFALLWRLRHSARWPLALLLGVGLVQGACVVSAKSYGYVEFSPLASWIMQRAPGLYHPEPEIFAERLGHHDDYIVPDKIYVRKVDGQPVTTLYHPGHPGIEAVLCGSGGALAPDNRYTASDRGWRYIDGPYRCLSGGTPQQTFQVEQFRAKEGVRLAAGWSGPEINGGTWNGVWSDGPRSRIVIPLGTGQKPATLAIVGNYLDGNTRTRVTVNGADLGWQHLDQLQRLALPSSTGAIEIELEHEAPHRPGDGKADQRALAFFLREITLR
jgi:hypothetical protein